MLFRERNDGAASLQIQIRPIDRLVFYVRNPRKNDAAVDRMCASIREFGFKIPVLARSDGEVVDGRLRLKAACKLAITEVPVILCDVKWEAQRPDALSTNGGIGFRASAVRFATHHSRGKLWLL